MRNWFPVLLVIVCAGSGCFRKTPPTISSKAGPQSAGDPVLGAVQNVRKAVQRVVTQNEMKGLHLFIENASAATGRMPSKELVLESVKKDDPKLYQFLQDGLIVLTGIQMREGVWAYEKDAATNGGFVLSQNGVERLTAEEVKQRLGN